MRETFVSVGAGLTGGSAVVALREEGFGGDLVLIGAEPEVPYERPPLSKEYLRGEATFEDTLVREPHFYADKDIETRLGIRATKVDLEGKVVELEGGNRVPYDKVLIATGGRNRRPHDEVYWFWFDQYNYNLQYAGFATDWDELIVRGSLEQRKFVAFYLKGGRVLAILGMNRGKDVHQSMGLIKAGIKVDLARLRDEAIQVRDLASG